MSSLHADILRSEEEIELRMDQRNRRRTARQPLSETVEVSWEDRGRHTVRARLVDLIKAGNSVGNARSTSGATHRRGEKLRTRDFCQRVGTSLQPGRKQLPRGHGVHRRNLPGKLMGLWSTVHARAVA